MAGLAFLREIEALPKGQREVLVPLIAWQLSVEQPAFVLEGPLLDAVTAFLVDIQASEPGVADRLEQRLAAAGVSLALLQEIQVKANVAPLSAATFAPREPPKEGQAPGGLAAQLAFRGKR